MRTKNIIMNIQDNTEQDKAWILAQLSTMELDAKILIGKCPICDKPRLPELGMPVEGKIIPWYVIIRRTGSSLCVRCKQCKFQFTFTYRNLRKAADYCGVPDIVEDFKRFEVWEHRGKQTSGES